MLRTSARVTAVNAWITAEGRPARGVLQRQAFSLLVRNEEPYRWYTLDERQSVGDANGVEVEVPARDWILLIAE